MQMIWKHINQKVAYPIYWVVALSKMINMACSLSATSKSVIAFSVLLAFL